MEHLVSVQGAIIAAAWRFLFAGKLVGDLAGKCAGSCAEIFAGKENVGDAGWLRQRISGRISVGKSFGIIAFWENMQKSFEKVLEFLKPA